LIFFNPPKKSQINVAHPKRVDIPIWKSHHFAQPASEELGHTKLQIVPTIKTKAHNPDQARVE
jgi:hypothetical protein